MQQISNPQQEQVHSKTAKPVGDWHNINLKICATWQNTLLLHTGNAHKATILSHTGWEN